MFYVLWSHDTFTVVNYLLSTHGYLTNLLARVNFWYCCLQWVVVYNDFLSPWIIYWPDNLLNDKFRN